VRIGKRFPSSWPAVVVLAALAGPARAETASFTGVVDLDGRPVAALPAGTGPTVLVFTRTDCPISNRYAPELRRLGQRFTGHGVAFRLVYVDPAETPAAIREHARAYGLGLEVLRDPRHELVRLAGATVTPEAAVFVPDGAGPRLVYRGRIDDRAVDFGRARPQPRTRDLADVLESLTTGHALTLRTTTAVGCFIPELR
jgi:AhpC/TSA family protein